MKFPIPPGVFDIIPKETKEPWRASHLWTFVENHIRQIAAEYGFQEIRTPIFERTELFQRSVGETSDIVSKEMYTFLDKGQRSISLRPEGTAAVMRSFIENHLDQSAPIHKLFYMGPMFRYERSQAGRYRQHHQFGAEVIGSGAPEQDAEVIDLLYTLYNRLGLKSVTVNLNSIGDTESRLKYRTALQEYFRSYLGDLSEDSKVRLELNPLRILDSKDPKDKEINKGAPSILDFLNEECSHHFQQVQYQLQHLKIPFTINPSLVRGLDYYNKTVFEIVSGNLGAQNSLSGGGRYDGLLKTLGGPELPAIGFGTGIERIIQTLINQEIALPKPYAPDLFLIAMGQKAKDAAFIFLHQLRQNGIAALMDFENRKLNKLMQYANQIQAKYVAVIGDDELNSGIVSLKTMETGTTAQIPFNDLVKHLQNFLDINRRNL